MKNAKKKVSVKQSEKGTPKRKRRSRFVSRASLQNLKRMERYLKSLLGYVKVEQKRAARLQKIEKKAKQAKGRRVRVRKIDRIRKVRIRRIRLEHFKQAKNVAEIAYLILAKHSRPMSLETLATQVVAKWWKKPGMNFKGNFKFTLSHDRRFGFDAQGRVSLRQR
ncbi:MAG: hypothetical protein WC528_00765 [Patescibacteria group bacterium]